MLWVALILILTITGGQHMPESDIWSLLTFDKFAHFFVFSVLSFLLAVGFGKQNTYLPLHFKPVTYSVVFSVAYGFIIELLQFFSPGRHFEWQDLLANAAGTGGGALLFYLIYKARFKKLPF